MQWTSSGTSFLPPGTSAAPGWGLGSAVRLGSCGGILGQQKSTLVCWKGDCSVHEVPFTARFVAGLISALTH